MSLWYRTFLFKIFDISVVCILFGTGPEYVKDLLVEKPVKFILLKSVKG